MNIEKKLIQLFKSFVEKVFVPQIRRIEGSLVEWNRFNNLLSQDSINYGELQAYVESIGQSFTVNNLQKSTTPVFLKKKQDTYLDASQQSSFNPSKTFGGQRARVLLQKAGYEELPQRKQYGGNNQLNMYRNTNTNVNNNQLLQSVEKMLKGFTENHNRIESIMGSQYFEYDNRGLNS